MRCIIVYVQTVNEARCRVSIPASFSFPLHLPHEQAVHHPYLRTHVSPWAFPSSPSKPTSSSVVPKPWLDRAIPSPRTFSASLVSSDPTSSRNTVYSSFHPGSPLSPSSCVPQSQPPRAFCSLAPFAGPSPSEFVVSKLPWLRDSWSAPSVA